MRLGVIETMRGSCDDDATGDGVLLIGTGGWYSSIDEYSLRCDPQGTRGSGGDAGRNGCVDGKLGRVGINGGVNGDGSIRGDVVDFGGSGT